MTGRELEQRARDMGLVVTLSGHMRAKDCAKFLGVHIRTLARWRDEAIGPAYSQPSRDVFYSCADLAEFLNDVSRHVPRLRDGEGR